MCFYEVQVHTRLVYQKYNAHIMDQKAKKSDWFLNACITSGQQVRDAHMHTHDASYVGQFSLCQCCLPDFVDKRLIQQAVHITVH